MSRRKPSERIAARLGAAVSPLMLALLLGGAVAGCGSGKPVRSAEVLFAENCAHCHGADGTGDPRTLPLYPRVDLTRSAMGAARERVLIHDRIARGYTTMPGFQGKLQPEEIGNLVNKCLDLAAPAAAKPSETPKSNGG